MPEVRLAYNPGPVNAYGALRKMDVRLAWHPQGSRSLESPTVRLAVNGAGQGEMNGALFAAPTVRLAAAQGQAERNGSLMGEGARPGLLVSYVYLRPFLRSRELYDIRDWVMDSGAYSAFKSGVTIELEEYNDRCLQLLEEDPQLTEVYALDVIDDWRGSVKNYEATWKAGVPAIPTYHLNDPESLLLDLAAAHDKIAIGGMTRLIGSKKLRFAEQCFARVWPKRIHGFGVGSESLIMALPWHSVDATNWEIGPCKFGRWNTYGQMSVRGSKQDLRVEVDWYLRLEARAQRKWREEMKQLEGLPTVRLAYNGNRNVQSTSRRTDKALGKRG